MAQIVAADPGITTGAAFLDTATGSVDAMQSKDPFEVMDWIHGMADADLKRRNRFLIEEFVGGGYRNKESNHTLKVIGYLFYQLWDSYGLEPLMRAPQKRLAGLTQAKSYEGLPGPHGYDALAHCITYAREKGW